jgi:hypothetical protein
MALGDSQEGLNRRGARNLTNMRPWRNHTGLDPLDWTWTGPGPGLDPLAADHKQTNQRNGYKNHPTSLYHGPEAELALGLK